MTVVLAPPKARNLNIRVVLNYASLRTGSAVTFVRCDLEICISYALGGTKGQVMFLSFWD